MSSLSGRLVEITLGGFKVAYGKILVPTPHWRADLASLTDGAGSRRPAAFVRGTATAKVTLDISEAEGVAAEGILRGHLGGLTVEGRVPFQPGRHVVDASITGFRGRIGRFAADASWSLVSTSPSLVVDLSPATRLEVFELLGPPAAMYRVQGVWTEVLRFLVSEVELAGHRHPKKVLGRITRFCHSRHGLVYSADGGHPAYGVQGAGGTFCLWTYLQPAKPKVNCYDQLAALQALGGAVGICVDWLRSRRFGYLRKTRLVGVGDCNNPFFLSDGFAPEPVVDPERCDRSSFGNHGFGGLGGQDERIYDACAGPHLGTETRSQYLEDAVDDQVPTHCPKTSSSAQLGDINTHAGVRKVV